MPLPVDATPSYRGRAWPKPCELLPADAHDDRCLRYRLAGIEVAEAHELSDTAPLAARKSDGGLRDPLLMPRAREAALATGFLPCSAPGPLTPGPAVSLGATRRREPSRPCSVGLGMNLNPRRTPLSRLVVFPVRVGLQASTSYLTEVGIGDSHRPVGLQGRARSRSPPVPHRGERGSAKPCFSGTCVFLPPRQVSVLAPPDEGSAAGRLKGGFLEP